MSKENVYTFDRVKLSNLYHKIGRFLKEYGDVDIYNISSCSGYDDKTKYLLGLSDLNSFDTTKYVGEIRIKYEEVPYSEEEWRTRIIKDSKIDTKFYEDQ